MPASLTEPCPACGAMLDVTGAQIFAERTCPVCSTSIHVRRKFGHYELMEVVGQGGQGLVYKAVDNNLNRLVALKLLRTEYSEDKEFVRQFESEARITASINHPNVVRVFSFGADEGHVYLAMELVGKGTLDDLMEKLGRVPEARALQIGIEVAQGLKAGHEQGLIHRDVKPGNVLFGEDGSSKIVDFGLAMLLEQAAAESGEIWGTPYYLSPERLYRKPEDFRSDIYSLGATLFHAIAGRPPFEAEDATGVAMKHMNATAASIQAWAPDVTNATAFVINRTLSKNPEERYASYDEFIEQLQFAREEALSKNKVGQKKTTSRVVIEDAKSQKANSMLTIATLAVLIAGVGVGGWVMSKAGKDNQSTTSEYAALSSFGPEWTTARDLLATGKNAEAIEAFRKLASGSKGDQRTWATIFQALSHHIAGNTSAASSALSGLDTGTPLGKFYAGFAPTLASTSSVSISAAEALNRTNYESLGLLFLSIKSYQAGDIQNSPALFRMFTTASPEREFEFLSEFKRVARQYEDELTSFGMLSGALKNAKSAKERDTARVALEDFRKTLLPNSKLQPAIVKAIEDAEKAGKAADELRRKANLAASAKVSVSATNPAKDDRAEFAVDGDPETRWSSGSTEARWIKFDFGAPKSVSRWAVRHAPPSLSSKSMNRTRDFDFEQSADGSAWTVVDSVFGNRSDFTDRVVKPFTARYVRINVRNSSWDAKDKSARIHEVEISDASEQSKVPYGPTEATAIRFSPDSPLSIRPVGSVFAMGSATYAPATGRYSIKGAGEDIWALADSFHFVQQAVEGDFTIVARVTKIDGRTSSKAGIMVRSDFSPGSSHVLLAAIPGGKIQMISRKEQSQGSTGPTIAKPTPVWFKLVRTGPIIAGYESSNGTDWKKLGEDTPKGLGAIAIVGLAVCAHTPADFATGEFDKVSIQKSN